MTVSPPAPPPAPHEGDTPSLVRTSLKLRPVVHAYFRDRAHESRTSMQKLIESLCEAAYAARQETVDDRQRRADRRTAKRKDTP